LRNGGNRGHRLRLLPKTSSRPKVTPGRAARQPGKMLNSTEFSADRRPTGAGAPPSAQTAPPASVASQASPQALVSSRTRRM
jgi:hypothetical protein